MKDWQLVLLAIAGGIVGSELLRRYLGSSYRPQGIQREVTPWGSESPKRIVRRGRVI